MKKRFEKNSTWVLVGEDGLNIKDEDINDPDEGSIPFFKDSDEADIDKSKKFSTNQPQPKKTDLAAIRKIVAPKYKKVKINIDGSQPEEDIGNHYIQKMSIQQFRECMGLLGLESNAFLSDRIFEVVDTDRDEYITFEQFSTIMDTLINGDEDEKQEFSFSLIEGNLDRGYFSFDEFSSFMMKIIAHWCIMTGSQLKVDKEGLREIFDRLGPRDGLVELEQYKKALKENPQFFDWFDLLNSGSGDGKKARKDNYNLRLQAVGDIINLQKKLDTLKNKIQTLEQIAIDQASQYEESYSHRDDLALNFESRRFPESSFQQEPVRRNFISLIPTPQDQFQSVKTQSTSQVINQSCVSQPFVDKKQHLQLKYLLNPDPLLKPPTPKMVDLFLDKFLNEEFSYNLKSASQFEDSSDATTSDIGTEVNGAKSHLEKEILEIKKRKDILRERKKEYGEKKAQLQKVQKNDEVDDDIINDPELSEEEKDFNQTRNMHDIRYDDSYSPASMIHANSTGFQILRNHHLPLARQSRVTSFKSARSGLRHDNQQSSHGGRVHQQKPRRDHNAQNNNSRRRKDSSFDRETSPQLTHDGSRSDAQGGGPIFSKKRTISDNGTDLRNHFQSTMKHSFHHDNSQLHPHELNYSPNKSDNRTQIQTQQLKEELAEIYKLTHNMLSQFADHKDQDLHLQMNEILQANNNKETVVQEESKEFSQNSPDGGINNGMGWFQETVACQLRPTDEIEEYFRTRNRKVLGQSSGKDKKRLSSGKKSKSVHKTLSKKASNKAFIHIGHDNWNLVLHMMMGVRQSVRNVMHEEVFELIDQDFNRKYSYELVSKKTKNMRAVFEFFDFSPRVFHRIRTMYNITPDSYLKSCGPENLIGSLLMGNISSLKEQCSTGKSGSFFYYTADNKFMLKTISSSEFVHLKAILKDYYEHLTLNPHSLITRFFGLHKIKCAEGGTGKQRIYFVIMANVFNTSREINMRFDLKGSTQGRKTKKTPDEYVDSAVALKDLDLLEQELKINVDPFIREALISQVKSDVKLFQRLNINDYSLLLGIHYINDEQEADTILSQSTDIKQLIGNTYAPQLDKKDQKIIRHLYSDSFINNYAGGEENKKRPEMPFFECHDGGIIARDKKCIYFIGIIDTLTVFGTKKMLEYHLKSIRYGNKISCIPPKQYGERYFKFISSVFDYSQQQPSNNNNNEQDPTSKQSGKSQVSKFRY